MTQLELVFHDAEPIGHNNPIKRTVIAMSTSHTALREYCKDNFKEPLGRPDDNYVNYLTIQPSNVAIVQFDYKSEK